MWLTIAAEHDYEEVATVLGYNLNGSNIFCAVVVRPVVTVMRSRDVTFVVEANPVLIVRDT